MERQKGKTVITMETFQRTTIRSRKTAKIVLCERCAAELSPSETAAHIAPGITQTVTHLLPPGTDERTEEQE